MEIGGLELCGIIISTLAIVYIYIWYSMVYRGMPFEFCLDVNCKKNLYIVYKCIFLKSYVNKSMLDNLQRNVEEFLEFNETP